MTEPRDDARDDFSIAVLADEHMGSRSPIADRDHELLRVPKGQNDVAPLSIQHIDRLMPSGFTAHRSSETPDQGGRDRWEYGKLEPIQKVRIFH
jgi:hypothetical protein